MTAKSATTRARVTPLATLLFELILVVTITGVGVMDAHAADERAPACKTAEVNPVTGHVFCIDPLGAEVAPRPTA
jgi:hypothetical protein